jgi:hypothetical protein
LSTSGIVGSTYHIGANPAVRLAVRRIARRVPRVSSTENGSGRLFHASADSCAGFLTRRRRQGSGRCRCRRSSGLTWSRSRRGRSQRSCSSCVFRSDPGADSGRIRALIPL